MSILVDKNTRVLCQGITGKAGQFHTKQCLEYGTQMVGGVTPGKGGETIEGVPVFDTVDEAVRADRGRRDDDLRAAGVRRRRDPGSGRRRHPPDRGHHRRRAGARHGPRATTRCAARRRVLIGPNCPGVITPEECKIGIMPGYIHSRGPVGVISRSGTLTYEAVWQLTSLGLGQSTCVGLGGDPIVGTSFVDLLELFEDDPQTEAS